MSAFAKRSVFVLALLLALLPFTSPQRQMPAKAASLQAYPSYCLGGWENPSLASGRPDVPEGENTFMRDNSAVLSGKVAQLFCGYFQSDNKTFLPEKITLKFSWKVDFAIHEDADTKAWNTTITDTLPLSTSSDTWFAPTSTIPLSPPTEETSSTIPLLSEPEELTPIFPEATSTVATSTSFKTTSGNFLSRFVKTVFAESPAVSFGADFMEVRYSVDGAEWKSAGRVGESNWKNFSVELPISSWDDIDKLQIELVPLPTNNFPTIYLDGLQLEMIYNRSFADVVSEGMSTVVDVASDVGEAINDAVDAAATALADAVASIVEPQEATSPPEEILSPAPEKMKTPKRNFNFKIARDFLGTTGILPWARSEDLMKAGKETARGKSAPPVTVSVGATEDSIRLEGTCTRPYYVVLLFAKQNDYLEDPSRAIMNRASPCMNGIFSVELRAEDFPPTLADGTYYLMTADQGTDGPWLPHASIREIVISGKMLSL